MPLEILALLVVLGVGGVVLAIHLTGGTVTAEITSSEAALLRFAEDFPDAIVEEVIVAKDRRSAILALEGDDCGVIHAIGDRFLTRYLVVDDNPTAKTKDGVTISLRVDDISWRGSDFAFSSVEDSERALAILKRVETGGADNG